MKVALYARVSTDDRDQNPESQLLALRELARQEGWEVAGEYVDRASARDLVRRTAWRQLQIDAARRRFKAVLVFKLDRAFRSVRDMHQALASWEKLGVQFRSLREPQIDTTTPMGNFLLNILAAVAELELSMISERVKAGMERARRQGKHIGRPRFLDRRGARARVDEVLARVRTGEVSKRQAARELGVSRATVLRILALETL